VPDNRWLLDTRAFLWGLVDSPRLGGEARAPIADPAAILYVSAASAWEIAIKAALGAGVWPSRRKTGFPEKSSAGDFAPLRSPWNTASLCAARRATTANLSTAC
jgi:PIN domain nuclease of toxin-antitoxin system